jgi:hypothetical protein
MNRLVTNRLVTNRLVTLTEGQAMVVTDLHGDWDLYCKYRDHFLALQSKGEADYLILTGDLIHSEGLPELDKSLEIILDVTQLRKRLGDKLIYLLGNHEMPHLYAITLQKGETVYTPGFEARMGEHRSLILDLFDSLPFFVRTKAGISIAHAGGAATLAQKINAELLFNFSHQILWAKAEELLPIDERPSLRVGFARLNHVSYDEMAKELLSITSPSDPRYDDLLIGAMVRVFPEFDLLWETFFNKNEVEYGENRYSQILNITLKAFSWDFTPQVALVSGHIFCPNGFQIISEKQLRLASGLHAKPFASAKYLVFDTYTPMKDIGALTSCLKSIF